MKARTVRPGRLAPLVIAATALLIAAPAYAADCAGEATSNTAPLVVQVTNVKPVRGQVAVTVYPNDKSRFLAPGAKLARQRVKAEATTEACFNLPPGTYAIAVYHDANSNKNFDRNLAGLPAEGYGFSNDAPSRIGLPPLEAVRFRFKAGDPPLKITMRYLNQ
jgi:uncharacterized protein (DUF2141 family)